MQLKRALKDHLRRPEELHSETFIQHYLEATVPEHPDLESNNSEWSYDPENPFDFPEYEPLRVYRLEAEIHSLSKALGADHERGSLSFSHEGENAVVSVVNSYIEGKVNRHINLTVRESVGRNALETTTAEPSEDHDFEGGYKAHDEFDDGMFVTKNFFWDMPFRESAAVKRTTLEAENYSQKTERYLDLIEQNFGTLEDILDLKSPQIPQNLQVD